MVPESVVKPPLVLPLTRLYASISPSSFIADLSLRPWAFPYPSLSSAFLVSVSTFSTQLIKSPPTMVSRSLPIGI
eukprot:scaffold330227_cov52-Tisochrysis_lutea.AAC.1